MKAGNRCNAVKLNFGTDLAFILCKKQEVADMQKEFETLIDAIREGDEEEAVKVTTGLIEKGTKAMDIMNQGLSVGIQQAGELYEEGEFFLPDLVCAADAMKASLEIVQPLLDAEVENTMSKGTVVMATVQGDIHDIGKTIVASMLTASGYTVIDLGCDVPNEEVIRVAKENNADIIGLSALLATTMQEQKNIVEALRKEGSDIKVMIGGAPVTEEFAESIHADGYSEDAIEAIKKADELMGI